MNIADLRQDYRLQSLDITDVNPDPLRQFHFWFEDAVKAQILEPNAMVLATISADLRPSARVVLLKGLNEQGFVFYTNYHSRKAAEMGVHPNAALCFNWLDLQRQVRIEGRIEKVTTEESDAYFESRPKGSRLGAWASPQSQIIENRYVLEEKQAFLEKKYADTEGVPRPQNWGGYVLIPDLVEFWQGRSSRLHDRIQYRKMRDGSWRMERLAP